MPGAALPTKGSNNSLFINPKSAFSRSALSMDLSFWLLFSLIENRQILQQGASSSESSRLQGRELFLLVLLHGYLAVTQSEDKH